MRKIGLNVEVEENDLLADIADIKNGMEELKRKVERLTFEIKGSFKVECVSTNDEETHRD